MTNNIDKFNHLPQRQKKFARTKIALLNALLEALETQPLSEVTIKSLCDKAEISEPTFFNYFESKQHMLLYFVQIWSIEMNALARRCQQESNSPIGAIKAIFLGTARDVADHPRVMLEIIAFQTRPPNLPPHTISDAEKWLFFPDIDDVESLASEGLESILPPLIRQAVSIGELPENTDEPLLFLLLSSLFFGTPLLLLNDQPEKLPQLLELELNLILDKLSA